MIVWKSFPFRQPILQAGAAQGGPVVFKGNLQGPGVLKNEDITLYRIS